MTLVVSDALSDDSRRLPFRTKVGALHGAELVQDGLGRRDGRFTMECCYFIAANPTREYRFQDYVQ
jgi:hypothetical protein